MMLTRLGTATFPGKFAVQGFVHVDIHQAMVPDQVVPVDAGHDVGGAQMLHGVPFYGSSMVKRSGNPFARADSVAVVTLVSATSYG